MNEAFDGFTFDLLGISRTANDDWFTGFDNAHQDFAVEEPEAKEALTQDPAHVLNIYVADLDGTLGFARFPFAVDYDGDLGPGGTVGWPEGSFWHGVMVDFTTLPGGGAPGYDLGDIAVHEVGHYFGLYHTYRGKCNGSSPPKCAAHRAMRSAIPTSMSARTWFALRAVRPAPGRLSR